MEAGDRFLCYWKCFMSVLHCEAECPVDKRGCGDALPLGEMVDQRPFCPYALLKAFCPGEGLAGCRV